MKTPLSQRLQALSSLIGVGEIVWDIGCDHGLLGLSFLNDPAIKVINLVDPSEEVIKSLKKQVIDSYITIPPNLIIHQLKGQQVKLERHKNCIFIAGMGGKEIKEILEAISPQLDTSDRIVISPHRKILELRQYLSTSSLKLIQESLIYENHQYYQVLALSLIGDKVVHPYGNEIWEGELGKRYQEHILKEFKGHRNELSQGLVAYLGRGGL